MKRFWHLPWLLCSFIGSFLIIPFPFAGPDGTGMIIAMVLLCLAVTHFVAMIIGFAMGKRTRRTLFVIMGVALIPTLFFSIIFLSQKAHDAWYLKHQAVYDRFRDNVVSPIPASVSNLEFVPFDQWNRATMMLRFTVSPQELDSLIRAKGFRQINSHQFRKPDDPFTDPNYMPLAEPVTFYIFDDIKGGYPDKGIGEGYTLKVSGDRKHVIFRRESASDYLDQDREDPAKGNDADIKTP